MTKKNHSIKKHFSPAFEHFVSVLNGIGTLGILGLMVMINADIFSRELLGSPIRGVPELVRLTIVAIVFLQLPHTFSVGHITRSDALLQKLRKRYPVFIRILNIIYYITGAILFTIILYWSWPYFVKAWTDDLFVGAVGVFMLPEWPVKLIILVGCFTLIIRLILMVIEEALGYTHDKHSNQSHESSL